MNKVAWLKIPTDFFERRTIKRILKERNGDKAALLLILLNILAGAVNDGGYVYITEDLPYEARDLSDMLSVTENAVKNALVLLEKYGEIEIYEDGKIMVSAFSMEQNMDSLAKYREANRERNKKYRKKKKETETNVTRDVTVISRDAIEVEAEKEAEKEAETETETEKDTDVEINEDDNSYEVGSLFAYNVIDFLNKCTGKYFDPENETYCRIINKLASKGYNFEGFKRVIRSKALDVNTFGLKPPAIFKETFFTH